MAIWSVLADWLPGTKKTTEILSARAITGCRMSRIMGAATATFMFQQSGTRKKSLMNMYPSVVLQKNSFFSLA